jgi:hypothetical protein
MGGGADPFGKLRAGRLTAGMAGGRAGARSEFKGSEPGTGNWPLELLLGPFDELRAGRSKKDL